MSENDELMLVLSTFPDQKSAEHAASTLVLSTIAACVNIIPGIQSVYQWENKLEKGQEYLLLIKTRHACYSRLEKCIQELHPYELPEVISVPITEGAASYLDWVRQNTKPISE